MASRNLLLGIFIALTLILAAVSAAEYLQTSQLDAQVSALSVQVSEHQTSGEVTAAVSQSLGQTGQIVIGSIGTFDFRAANYTAPNTFIFENVTFTSTPEVTTGAVCAQFSATLQNGSSYPLAACAFDVSIPQDQAMARQTIISFTSQSTPEAGLMFLPDGTAYVLVRS